MYIYIYTEIVENNDREGIRNLLFRDIGTGTNENYSFTGMAESFITGKQANPDDQWYDGAATIGWTSYRNLGFPLWIRCNDSEIAKFTSQDGLESYFTIKVSGRASTSDASQQLRDYEPVEYTVDFEGENSFFIIPRHPNYKVLLGLMSTNVNIKMNRNIFLTGATMRKQTR